MSQRDRVIAAAFVLIGVSTGVMNGCALQRDDCRLVGKWVLCEGKP